MYHSFCLQSRLSRRVRKLRGGKKWEKVDIIRECRIKNKIFREKLIFVGGFIFFFAFFSLCVSLGTSFQITYACMFENSNSICNSIFILGEFFININF